MELRDPDSNGMETGQVTPPNTNIEPRQPTQAQPQIPPNDFALMQNQLASLVAAVSSLQGELAQLKASGHTVVPPRRQMAEDTEVEEAEIGEIQYPDEATNVRDWAEVVLLDPEGLVRDLNLKYVASFQANPGGEILVESFTRLKGWILGVAAGSRGWTKNPQLVRLGNDLLKDLRMNYYYCAKRLPRSKLQRALAASSDDPLTKAAAKVELAEKRTKWDATPRKGMKSGWKGYGKGRKGNEHAEGK